MVCNHLAEEDCGKFSNNTKIYVYRNYVIFIANINFAKITKLFERRKKLLFLLAIKYYMHTIYFSFTCIKFYKILVNPTCNKQRDLSKYW